ncbi:MAG: ATP-dependent DNA helicase [Candidatus Bathyarchaeia archaeon]
MAEEDSPETMYICRRCSEIYSSEDYEESRFCKKCGTLLKRASAATPKLKEHVEDKTAFEEILKEFFPYSSLRPFQLDAIKFAFDTIKNGRIGLLSSPCGTGKSISVLTAFFAARELDSSVGKLLALTRTRNQLEIYCRELKGIKEKCDVNFVASIFKSKKEMCPHAQENQKLENISYRDFLQYCKGLKEGAFGEGCDYYEGTYDGWRPSWHAHSVVNKIKDSGPLMPDEVYETCRSEELCPYEVTKILARHADIIIGNYNYLLVDSVRGSVLGRAGWRIKDINCVFDEAHSLPYYAAGILSDELSLISVRRAMKEVKDFDVEDFGLLDALREVMIDLGKKVYKTYGLDVEHIIEVDSAINTLAEKMKINPEKLHEVISEVAVAGELVRQKRIETGKSPISYLSRCADFLSDWISLKGSGYIRYVKVDEDKEGRKNVRFGVRCLDPSLSAGVINELRSAILMSGTLWHTDYYKDVLGIEQNRCKSLELPSPFPAENRLILVDKSVTTKFERRGDRQWKRIADHLTRIIGQVNGRIAIYFPSYEVMHEIVKMAKFDLPMIEEEKKTTISEVFQFLKTHERCAVLGVARGKISEGVDLTAEGRSMLSTVIIVGLPYPKRTELQYALYKYFKEKFGNKAIEYANDIPCLNALAQAAGRLLRSPEDKGIIVIMDGRAAGRFKRKLPMEWRNEMKAHLRIEKILGRIKEFYYGDSDH